MHKKGGGATPTLTAARKSPTLQTEPRNFTLMKRYKQLLGKSGEDLAVDFLKKNGFEILERNYRYGHKEIDIIGKDKSTIVFIEVKTGRSRTFGSPQEWVNLKKQKNIIEVAQAYIQEHDLRDFDFRFDVVAISFERGTRRFKECFAIEHIKNAFMVG